MGLSSSDQISTEIASIIIQGSKQFNELFQQIDSKLSKKEQVLMSAAALKDNRSAINRLTNEFNISDEKAISLFENAKNAANELAIENNFSSLLESSWFKK